MKRTLFVIIALIFTVISCQKESPEVMRSVSFGMDSCIARGETPVLTITSTRPGQQLTVSVLIDGSIPYCTDMPLTIGDSGTQRLELRNVNLVTGFHTVHVEAVGCSCGRKAEADFSLLVTEAIGENKKQ